MFICVFSIAAKGFYNDMWQINRFTSNNMNNDFQGMYCDYHFDEQNHLTAIIYHYREGREGLPDGNSYFWYDEQCAP